MTDYSFQIPSQTLSLCPHCQTWHYYGDYHLCYPMMFKELTEKLDRIERRIAQERTEEKCFLCGKEDEFYIIIGYGSKYDMEPICPDCLDKAIELLKKENEK